MLFRSETHPRLYQAFDAHDDLVQCIASRKSSAKCRISHPFPAGIMDTVTHSQAQSHGEARRDAEEQEDEGCEASERASIAR